MNKKIFRYLVLKLCVRWHHLHNITYLNRYILVYSLHTGVEVSHRIFHRFLTKSAAAAAA